MMALTWLEIRHRLRSPALWGLLALLWFALAFLFLRLVEGYDELQSANLAGMTELSITRIIVQPWCQWSGLLLVLLVPLLTMQSIAGEKRIGTWSLLLVSGLRPGEIIVGKFLGLAILLTGLLLAIAAMPTTLVIGSTLDIGHFLAALLGCWLLLLAFTALGIFCSALVNSPSNAVMLYFGLLLVLALFHLGSSLPGEFSPLLYWLSPFSHFLPLVEARFNSGDLIWLLLFTSLFLWLAAEHLQHQRLAAERDARAFSGKVRYWLRTGVITAGIVTVALLSTRHSLTFDLSQNRINTLAPAATALVANIDQPLTIRAVVADDPGLRRKIDKALGPWLQASEKISLEFATPAQYSLRTHQPLNEQGRIVFEYGERAETIHSLGDTQVSRAIQKLVLGKDQWIVFLEGHGEKSLYDESDNGYSMFDQLLKQQGFRSQAINLARLPVIPDNTDLLVVMTGEDDLLPGERQQVEKYLQRGHPLLLLRDPGHQPQRDQVLRSMAITSLPGVVISANDQLRKLLAIDHPAILPVTDFMPHPVTAGLQGKMLLPLASALLPDNTPEWSQSPLLRSTDDSWNEISDLKGHVRFDEGSDETPGPLILAVAAQRELGDETQRTGVVGDSDFATNKYIGFGDNARFALQLLDWLTAPSATQVRGEIVVADQRLDMAPTTLLIAATLMLLVIPLLLLTAAWWQWRQRRKH